MNLRDLIDAFRRDCDDRVDPPLFSDGDITDWLNEAQRQACIRARLLLCRDEYPLSGGQRIVKLDDAIFELRRVELHREGQTDYSLYQTEGDRLDDAAPGWHAYSCPPKAFVHRDGEIELAGEASDGDVIRIEGFRLPRPMRSDTDCPEIGHFHHLALLHWALFRAHSVPDKEVFDPNRATEQEARFEYYFGRRPKASLRKGQSANNPHHNKCW